MAELASAFLGAVVGGAFSLLGAWLTLRGSTDYFDDLAIQHLRQKLDPDKNASMADLISCGKTIGLTEAETRQLVFLIKNARARRSFWRRSAT